MEHPEDPKIKILTPVNSPLLDLVKANEPPPLWIHEALLPCDEEEHQVLLNESIRRWQNGK